MILHASQHILLEGLVDYAGLFPPAALELAEVVRRYRLALEGPGASLLGRLICPAARLGDLLPLLVDGDHWRLSALLQQLEQLALVDDFHSRAPASVRVDSLEVVYRDAPSLERWADAWNYHLYFEVTPAHFAEAARLVAQRGPRLALKLRMGGLQPEAFPAVSVVEDFLQVLRQFQVAAKFTAGLHHALAGLYPLCYEANSPRHRMLGFVNLFAAGAFFWWGLMEGDEFQQALGLEQLEFVADGEGLLWRGRRLGLDQLQEARRWLRSFGSCSFEEPLEELMLHRWIQ